MIASVMIWVLGDVGGDGKIYSFNEGSVMESFLLITLKLGEGGPSTVFAVVVVVAVVLIIDFKLT